MGLCRPDWDGLGISFQYPDNWTLDDSDALLGRQSVTVYSPGGAFWSVAIQPAGRSGHAGRGGCRHHEAGIRRAAEAVPAEETVAGHELTGYDLAFYCLDLTNTALVRSLRNLTNHLYDLLSGGG